MMTKSTSNAKRPPPQQTRTNTTNPKRRRTDDKPDNQEKTPLPPFATWFKKSLAKGAPKFKHGDTKEQDGKTWHFCGYPNHQDNVRWHPFNSKWCRAHKSWKAKKTEDKDEQTEKKKKKDDEGTANPGIVTPDNDTKNQAPSDVTAALAHALQLASGNDMIYGIIADALSHIEHA